MKRHPFLIFITSLAAILTGLLIFIQSEGFARFLKGFVARHLPSDLGIQADFSDLSVGLFPPSVSIRNPHVELSRKNLINLPPGSSISAKKIDLRFKLFQMFSGNIRINEVAVVNGDVKVILHSKPEPVAPGKSRFRPQLNWNELIEIRAEAVGLENTSVHILFADSHQTIDLFAEQLRLSQWSGGKNLGYELRADLRDLTSSALSEWIAPGGITRLSGIAHVNSESLQIDDVSALLRGVNVHISGKVRGDILSTKELPFEARTDLKADIKSVSEILTPQTRFEGGGTLHATLNARGDLQALRKSLKLSGKVEGEELRYDRWSASQLQAEASYSASTDEHPAEIVVSHAVISSPEVEREGGHRPASGGRIEVGSFKAEMGQRKPVLIPLKLDRAHIHWLAAGELDAVYPLDTRLSGSILCAVLFPSGKSPWEVQTKVELSSEIFQLDNQRYLKEAPLRRILRFPGLKISGAAEVNPTGLVVPGLLLNLPHTQLRVTGSVTDKSGFNLTGIGNVAMADFREIAESPVVGDGILQVHAHGPRDRIILDFDGDLKNTEYLRMQIGDFKGRISYKDEPELLSFSQIHARKGQTAYTVEGDLDLSKKGAIDLSVNFPAGNVYDVSKIFENLTQGLWWYPRSLTGFLSGSGRVTGGISLNEMEISTFFNGSNWEYLGERIRNISLKGGYDRGKYFLSDFHGVKQLGRFSGKISYDAEQRFFWEFNTNGMQVTDFDHLARLDVPFRGDLQVDSQGSGKEFNLISSSRFTLSNLSVRGARYLPSSFELKTENGYATGEGNAFGKQGALTFAYGLKPGTNSSFKLAADHIDFTPLLLLFNPKLMQDPQLSAFATGGIQLEFPSGAIEKSSGLLSVKEYQLSKSGTQFRLDHPLSTRILNGDFLVSDLTLVGPAGNAVLNLRGRPEALAGSLSGELDLGIAEFLTPTIAKASGVADLDFTIEGVLKSPKIFGTADVDGGTLRVASVDSPFENATGMLQFRQNVMSIESLQADLGGGRVTLDGTISFFPDKYPTIALKGGLTGNRVRVFPFQYVKVRGNLGVNGEDRPYLIDGALVVESALSKEKMIGSKQEEGLKSLQFAPANSGQLSLGNSLFKLKIDVNAENGIQVQNDLFFDTELKAHVTVVNTLEAPRILGSAELIQGKMKFKDRIFQVQSGSALFDNPNLINPQFNLSAATDVSNTKISLYASGRPNKFKIDLTSNPAMNESEIISLLALGNLSSDATKRIAGISSDRSAVQQGQAASLLLQSMDFNREVEEKTGFEVQLNEYENTVQGQSIFSRSAGESMVAPKIVVKRRIGDRVTLSYGSTVGVDVNKQTEANAELRVSPGFSVIGVWDTYDFNDLQQKRDSQSSYGFDFRLQKRFK